MSLCPVSKQAMQRILCLTGFKSRRCSWRYLLGHENHPHKVKETGPLLLPPTEMVCEQVLKCKLSRADCIDLLALIMTQEGLNTIVSMHKPRWYSSESNSCLCYVPTANCVRLGSTRTGAIKARG
jgi:hypothetical protein